MRICVVKVPEYTGQPFETIKNMSQSYLIKNQVRFGLKNYRLLTFS